MAHTPGPWDWGPHSDELVGRYEVNAGEGRQRAHICECHSNRQQTRKVADEEAAANARLIAAAPELLEALQSLIDLSDDGSLHIEGSIATEDPVITAARAAIAKAEGRE
jgi:hypothetical protein